MANIMSDPELVAVRISRKRLDDLLREVLNGAALQSPTPFIIGLRDNVAGIEQALAGVLHAEDQAAAMLAMARSGTTKGSA